MAQVDSGGDSGGDITNTLDYLAKRLCSFCDHSKIYVQLIYDVAVLSGIKSLLSILANSVSQSVTCVTGEDLQHIDFLISDVKSTIAMNMLKLYHGGTIDANQLIDNAMKLTTEISGIEHSLAYKLANCVNSLAFKLDSCTATSNELRQLLALLSQAQQQQAQQPQAQQLGKENKNLKTKEQTQQ